LIKFIYSACSPKIPKRLLPLITPVVGSFSSSTVGATVDTNTPGPHAYLKVPSKGEDVYFSRHVTIDQGIDD
jgi:hypothetical protein